MEKDRLYEKIGILKNENLSNTDIAKKLSDDNLTLVEAMEVIHNYEYIQRMGKRLQSYFAGVKPIEDFNEYGIPMINTDADW